MADKDKDAKARANRREAERQSRIKTGKAVKIVPPLHRQIKGRAKEN